ncbi:MAG: hypothetical protein WDM96_04695 [Lacunisphaera sp.]
MTTSYSLLRLIQPPGRIVGGRVLLRSAREGEIDVTALPANSRRLRQVRGGLVSMIFQEPMTALSPVHTVGNQIAEVILLHGDATEEGPAGRDRDAAQGWHRGARAPLRPVSARDVGAACGSA